MTPLGNIVRKDREGKWIVCRAYDGDRLAGPFDTEVEAHGALTAIREGRAAVAEQAPAAKAETPPPPPANPPAQKAPKAPKTPKAPKAAKAS